ncbi:MAG: hypothetical protein KGI97_03105 [Alphaproteobacteria bacterium]|nr:hypothetical protein [Alphaproteobacteria bacterium]
MNMVGDVYAMLCAKSGCACIQSDPVGGFLDALKSKIAPFDYLRCCDTPNGEIILMNIDGNNIITIRQVVRETSLAWGIINPHGHLLGKEWAFEPIRNQLAPLPPAIREGILARIGITSARLMSEETFYPLETKAARPLIAKREANVTFLAWPFACREDRFPIHPHLNLPRPN